MTQLSSNLLTYEQLLIKVNRLISILNQRSGITKEEIASEYSDLLNEVRNQIGSPLTKYDPYIKGEPPRSDKINTFFRSCTEDLSTIARQIDLLNAKTVSVFNLFNREIENEKKFSERIASKAKVLQMYSRSPSDDLVYIGDSFDNDDYIDYTKITKGLNPLIKNGSLSLPVIMTEKMFPNILRILDKNGFVGNNHEIVKSINSEGNNEYKFVFETSEVINNLNSIKDSNPLTYFEYEILNVDKTSAMPAQSIPASNNEFKFIRSEYNGTNERETTLVDWSNHPINDPLEMTIELSTQNPKKSNSIDIVPYFGSYKLVEVNEVIVFDKTGSSEKIIKSPIYIGSSLIPTNLQVAKNYFYNKCTLRFSEREVSKVQIKFVQKESSNIDIQHVYWKPTESNKDNPFVDLERFNPDALSRDIYEVVEYNKFALLPPASNPLEFKRVSDIYKTVEVSLKKKPTSKSVFVIELTVKPESGPNEKIYFEQWLSETALDEDGNNIVIKVPYFIKNIEFLDGEITSKTYPSRDDAKEDLELLKEQLYKSSIEQIENIVSAGVVENIQILNKNTTPVERINKYLVSVKTEKELYSAKRWAIGVRDIEVYLETFSNEFEIVSTPFLFDLPVEALMLSIDSDIDDTMLKNCKVESYISVDNGSQWIQISPIQLDFAAIPEVVYFNQSIVNEFKVSGASYFNYPEIPKEVKNVIVKIRVRKNSGVNFTPNIYSYQLIAKVKRS